MVERFKLASTSMVEFTDGSREFVRASDYDALAAELEAQIEDCTVNYNARVELIKTVEALEAALKECEQVRDSWCKAFTEQRDDAEALVRRCAALETKVDPMMPCPKCGLTVDTSDPYNQHMCRTSKIEGK